MSILSRFLYIIHFRCHLVLFTSFKKSSNYFLTVLHSLYLLPEDNKGFIAHLTLVVVLFSGLQGSCAATAVDPWPCESLLWEMDNFFFRGRPFRLGAEGNDDNDMIHLSLRELKHFQPKMHYLPGNIKIELKMTDADGNAYNQGKEFHKPASL